jgi:hypothetical protein
MTAPIVTMRAVWQFDKVFELWYLLASAVITNSAGLPLRARPHPVDLRVAVRVAAAFCKYILAAVAVAVEVQMRWTPKRDKLTSHLRMYFHT